LEKQRSKYLSASLLIYQINDLGVMRMSEKYVIAIDQGTTGTTILLLNQAGQALYKYHRDFPQSYPQPGWVEHDPELIWRSVLDGVQEILHTAPACNAEIAAIGITNQRETVLIWDRVTGRPVYPAVVWQCRRTAKRCQELTDAGWAERIGAKTGLRPDPYFSATKLEWILQTFPEVRKRAEKGELLCGTIDTWLIWKLTGGREHVTEFSNASRTMLFNIEELCWDSQMLELFQIPAALLPQVRPSSGLFGYCDPEVTGRPIPITAVLGDQQAALFGQGCLTPGTLKNTYGTGCFLLMNTGSKLLKPDFGLLTTIAWGFDGRVDYALEGSVFVAGAIIQWLRDELGIIKQAADSEKMAQAVPDNGGVYLVPAFTGMGTPHWDPFARGLIIGLTRGCNRNHIVRAALEGIAFQVREVIESMGKISGRSPQLIKADGGAAANNFLLQFQADLCNIVIERNASVESTAIGVGFMAGLAVGFWENPGQLQELNRVERHFSPAIGHPERQNLCRNWQRAVERAKVWVEK
jgi:glycerol kinase